MDLDLKKQPTESELREIENESSELQLYVLYRYFCHHEFCQREFISNLSPKEAFCPRFRIIHQKDEGKIELLDYEIKFKRKMRYNWFGSKY